MLNTVKYPLAITLFSILAFGFSFFISTTLVLAQTTAEWEELSSELQSEGQPPPPEGVDLTPPERGTFGSRAEGAAGANCFDYYTFQSVQVAVGTERDSYSPDDNDDVITFSGEVINENEHPVVDGNIFVRIAKENDNYRAEGHDVVDEFIAVEDIGLFAGESKPVEFSWDAPADLESGQYRASFFFSVDKRFNLGGLPFTNEVVVGLTQFEIDSGTAGAVRFDRGGTEVNGQQYRHIGGWPRVSAGSPVEISQPIVNTLGESQDVAVQYDLYYWDSLNEEDFISTEEERITIPAGDTRTATYNIPSMDDSVYYLRITAQYEGGQSIVNVRVVNDETERPRLNYPAITKFPLDAGDTFTIFSCFHNTSNGVVDDASVEVSLEDKAGNVIGAAEYNGSIGSNMMAIAEDITVEKGYEYVRLIAQIHDAQGNVVEEYETVYDCRAFDTCPRGLSKELTIALVVIVVGVILAILARRFIGFENGNQRDQTLKGRNKK